MVFLNKNISIEWLYIGFLEAEVTNEETGF